MRADLKGRTFAERSEALRLALVDARRELGLTMDKLARMADVSYCIISNYEHKHMPSYCTVSLIKLADALGIDLNEYGYTEELIDAGRSYRRLPRVHRVAKNIYAHHDFGATMREQRLSQGLTQETLAGMIDVSPTTIVDWERGSKIPREKNLIAWCKALKTHPQPWLWARVDELKPVSND